MLYMLSFEMSCNFYKLFLFYCDVFFYYHSLFAAFLFMQGKFKMWEDKLVNTYCK